MHLLRTFVCWFPECGIAPWLGCCLLHSINAAPSTQLSQCCWQGWPKQVSLVSHRCNGLTTGTVYTYVCIHLYVCMYICMSVRIHACAWLCSHDTQLNVLSSVGWPDVDMMLRYVGSQPSSCLPLHTFIELINSEEKRERHRKRSN